MRIMRPIIVMRNLVRLIMRVRMRVMRLKIVMWEGEADAWVVMGVLVIESIMWDIIRIRMRWMKLITAVVKMWMMEVTRFIRLKITVRKWEI